MDFIQVRWKTAVIAPQVGLCMDTSLTILFAQSLQGQQLKKFQGHTGGTKLISFSMRAEGAEVRAALSRTEVLANSVACL